MICPCGHGEADHDKKVCHGEVDGRACLCFGFKTKEMIVQLVRVICAYESGGRYTYNFFNTEYEKNEHPDDALYRLFMEERKLWADWKADSEIVLIMLNG